MIYYFQRDYWNVPYPAKGYEKATVKSGGCGVVCASMVVKNLLGEVFPPEVSAKFAIEKGARVPGGTDMRKLSDALCDKFPMQCATSNSLDDLLACVKKGGIAIANVGGDRGSYKGVFSDGGHYVVVYGIAGKLLRIADPGLYASKYAKPYRSMVIVKGNEVQAAPDVLHKDAENRAPRYYLYTREEKPMAEEKPSVWAKESWEKAVKAKILDGTKPQEPLTREQLAVVLDRLKMLDK
jgi:hypothetical protein